MSYFDNPENWAAWQQELVELRAERERRMEASHKKTDAHNEAEAETSEVYRHEIQDEMEQSASVGLAFEPEPAPEPMESFEPEPTPEPMEAFEPEPAPEPMEAFEPEPAPEPMESFEPEPTPEPVESLEPEPYIPDYIRNPQTTVETARQPITLKDLEYEAEHSTSKIEISFNSIRKASHELGAASMREPITLDQLEEIVNGRAPVSVKNTPEHRLQQELSSPRMEHV